MKNGLTWMGTGLVILAIGSAVIQCADAATGLPWWTVFGGYAAGFSIMCSSMFCFWVATTEFFQAFRRWKNNR